MSYLSLPDWVAIERSLSPLTWNTKRIFNQRKITHCIPTKFLVQERFVPRAWKNYLIKLIRSSTFFENLKKYYLSFVKFIEMIGRATMRIFQFSRSDESNIKPLSLSLSLDGEISSRNLRCNIRDRRGGGHRSIQEISVPRYSRNIGAPLDATRFLNWVSKDVTLRRKRDAITGTASYCYDSWRKGWGRRWWLVVVETVERRRRGEKRSFLGILALPVAFLGGNQPC